MKMNVSYFENAVIMFPFYISFIFRNCGIDQAISLHASLTKNSRSLSNFCLPGSFNLIFPNLL